MPQTMLKYCKTLIEKVSFDNRLLNKEYLKCMGYLNEADKQKFTIWIASQHFSGQVTHAKKNDTGL